MEAHTHGTHWELKVYVLIHEGWDIVKNMYLYLIVSSLGSPQQKAARNNFNERPFPQFTYTGINGVVLRVTVKTFWIAAYTTPQ